MRFDTANIARPSRALVMFLQLSLVAGACYGQMAPPEPARWRTYAIIVDLDDLPRTYACDELWYKFRDLLKVLGARSDMSVMPYRCGHSLGARGRSPRVELRFALPEALPSAEARWLDLKARNGTVRLRPGDPSSLNRSDCALMREIKDTLFPLLPVHVTDYRLACAAPPFRGPSFTMSVQSLRPDSSVASRATGQRTPAGG